MRLKFGAFLLALIGIVAAPAAFASSPLTFVRDIPIPWDVSGSPVLPIGIVSFPAGGVGGVAYPAQRFLVTTEQVYVLPARDSNAGVTLLWTFPTSFAEGVTPTSSVVAGWVRSDGTRELVISVKPRNIVQFNLEDGSVISNEAAPPVVPGETSLQVDALGNGFALRSDQIFSLNIATGANSILPTAGSGSGNGQLSGSTFLSIGPDSLLYVLDLGNNRIEGFTPTGGYVRQFLLAPNVPVAPASYATQFAVGSDGRFYVGDDNGGGAVYDASGNLLGTYSTTPSINVRAPSRALISVDAAGTVLEIENAGIYIHEFVPSAPTIAQVIAEVQASDLGDGNSNSLVVKLQNAQASLDAGNNTAARNQLQAFINEVAALQASISLTPTTAAKLTADAQAIINSLPA